MSCKKDQIVCLTPVDAGFFWPGFSVNLLRNGAPLDLTGSRAFISLKAGSPLGNEIVLLSSDTGDLTIENNKVTVEGFTPDWGVGDYYGNLFVEHSPEITRTYLKFRLKLVYS